MKVYNEKEEQKSWAIRLIDEGDGDASIIAVDSASGNQLTPLLYFRSNGSIDGASSADRYLKDQGYDPYEHRNTYDDDGGIVVEVGERGKKGGGPSKEDVERYFKS